MEQKNEKAVIVISHGSKNQKASEQFRELVARVQDAKKEMRIDGAFFQFAEPSVPEKVAELVDAGYTDIVFIPFFLMYGNHVAEDIPELVADMQQAYSGVRFSVGNILYPDDRLVGIVVDRVTEVCV